MRRDVLQRSYDQFAERYDDAFGAQQAPKIHGLLRALPADSAGPYVDLGAGTGLLARMNGRPWIALDCSRAMLKLHPGRQRVQGDMERLPFADGCIGTLLSVTSLIDFSPRTPVVAEMARVLRPGGILALSVLAHENIGGLLLALGRRRFELLETLQLPPDVGLVLRKRAIAR